MEDLELVNTFDLLDREQWHLMNVSNIRHELIRRKSICYTCFSPFVYGGVNDTMYCKNHYDEEVKKIMENI